MFDRLRNKFHSVQENLTASLRGLSAVDSLNRSQTPKVDQEFNLDAGTELLETYQMHWAELHETAQENATKAQDVDNMIGKLHKKLQKKTRDIGQIGTILTRLPEVIHSVNELIERVVTLDELFDTVEKALIQFEDLVEIRELQDKQLDHRFRLALYKEKKLGQLENVRVMLAEEHSEKIRRHELRHQRLMKERQEAFEDQFRHDIEIYKETNAIPKISKAPESKKISLENAGGTLEEVKLEPDDNRALDEFLKDSSPYPS